MPTRFSHVWPYWGVDEEARPHPWIMVPLNGQNHVLLREGAGLSLDYDHGRIDVTEITRGNFGPRPSPYAAAGVNVAERERARLFSVFGKAYSAGTIEAKDNHGVVRATLDFSVKRQKTVRAAFNFVKDNAGHQTKYSLPDADHWADVINRIFLYQANVWLQKVVAHWVQVGQNLGDVVRFVSQRLTRDHGVPRAEHEWDVVIAKGYRSADWNLFLVWDYEQDITPETDNANAGTLDGNTLCEDNARAEPAETMAHEFGHFMGMDHPTAAGTGHWLMSDAGRTGNKIGKDDVNIANP